MDLLGEFQKRGQSSSPRRKTMGGGAATHGAEWSFWPHRGPHALQRPPCPAEAPCPTEAPCPAESHPLQRPPCPAEPHPLQRPPCPTEVPMPCRVPIPCRVPMPYRGPPSLQGFKRTGQLEEAQIYDSERIWLEPLRKGQEML